MDEALNDLPPLNALRVFETVSRHLNFRLAAEELGVTQGAVAQQVRGLEASLGIKLFERHPRTLALTEAGREYAVSIRQALILINEATRTLRPAPQRVTLSVTPTFAARWILPRLPDFTAAHPDIDLRIMASERLAQFYQDGVDIAVRYGQPPFGAGLNAALLFRYELIAVASPSLLAQHGAPQFASDSLPYTLLHDGHNLWPPFLAQAFPDGMPATPANLRFNQTALAIDAALGGQGIALTSPHFVKSELATGRLTQAFPARLTVDAGWYLVSPRKPRQHAPLDAVRRWLQHEADIQNGS